MKKRSTLCMALLAGALMLASCGSAEQQETTAASTAAAPATGAESISKAELVDRDPAPEECIELVDYKNIELEKQVEEVIEDAVDNYISSLVSPVEVTDPKAKAENGDSVMITYVGKVDGIAFAGGHTDPAYLKLGSENFEDGSPVFAKGLSDTIVGMKIGESKDVELTMIDSYEDKELAGKKVNVKVTLATIQGKDETAAAAADDTVGIVYAASIDGIAVEGCVTPSVKLELGSHSYIDGFEDGLVGAVKGETRDLNLKFPENYGNADLAGQETVFTVTVTSILRMPEIDDEWVKEQTGGQLETAEDYRASVREKLEQQAEDSAQEALRSKAWEILRNESTFKKLPKSTFDEGCMAFEKEIAAEAAQYNMTVEEYRSQLGMSELEYMTQKNDYGRNFAASKVLLDALMKAEKVDTDCEEYAIEMLKLCDMYGMEEADLVEAFGQETVDQYLMTQIAVDRVVKQAKIIG